MKFRYLLSILLFFVFRIAEAQNTVLYSNYYLNPSLYNPAWVGSSGHAEVFFNFRKQWVGFEGAPTTATLNLHVPLNFKSSIGFSAFQDQAGILRTTSGLITFAHQVHFGSSINENHKLSFGLSAGITNSFLKDPDNPTDPAVLNNTTSFVNGQFGLFYQLKNLNFSFAIPSLFKTYVASNESFGKPDIDAIKNTISSISYRFEFGKASFEPYFIYRTNEIENQFEGLGVFTINNLVWFGGSYRQNYGAAALGGIKLENKFKLGYAYEFSTGSTAGFNNGTHEIQLAIRVGKKQHQRPEPKKQSAPVQEEIIEQPSEPKKVEEIIEPKAEVIKETPLEQPKTEPVILEVKEPELEKPKVETKQEVTAPSRRYPEIAPGHYVVAGAFRILLNAKNFEDQLNRNSYSAKTMYLPDKQYYIVYVAVEENLEEAKSTRDKYRKHLRFNLKDAWILSVD